MQIIILISQNHIYANFLLKKLLLKYPKDIITIVESTTLLSHKTKLQALKKYLKISGSYYVFVQGIKQNIFNLGSFIIKILHIKNTFHPFYSYKTLAKKNGISILKTSNINNIKIVKLLKKLEPDVIISAFFNQILNEEILKIPTLASLNIHPALLPNYRGVSPVFWCLVNGEEQTGVTIHLISKKIDAGEIINQDIVKIEPTDTEHSLYKKCTNHILPLLFQTIDQLKNGGLRQEEAKHIHSSYFSLPSKLAVKKFRTKGKKFFTIMDLFKKF